MTNKNIPAEMKAMEHETDMDAIMDVLETGAEEPVESTSAAVHKAREHDPIIDAVTAADSDIGIDDVYKGIETSVVDTYKAVEDAVVGAYKTVEQGAVQAFTTVEDAFVGTFFTKPGESVEDAKKRMVEESKKQ